ncbi:hypothetical protein D7Z54_28915 [Salibacterium salarium]|uniref:Dolichyl-phosphate-mannose-protein mannosyltransferase n=2 Tax=Salibacterium salarium TaxID=284579 RepID=A0A3R9PFZ3_9BACI|nr:hypothetical protein D7Z54_28915 [Salibacterium salarium]
MLFLLLLSFAGYGLFFIRRYNIAPAVIPLFLFSSITVVLFVAGLLNLLQEAAYGIFIGGLLFLVYIAFTYSKKKFQMTSLLTPAFLFFAISCVCFMFLLEDYIFLHYDNFSHWGIIVKELFQSNSLPDESTIITYTTYPPGSALFIYYIVTVTGFSESMALIAQAILIAGALSPIFIFCSWKKPLYIAGFLLLSATLLFVDSRSFYTLLVDPLLAYLSIAVIITAYYYRDDWKYMALTVMPMLSLLILTKSSGKIFLAFCLLWMIGLFFRFIRKNALPMKHKLFTIGYMAGCTVLVPFCMNLLWSRYTANAYSPDNQLSKFSITKETLTDINKSPEVIETLLPEVLDAAFDVSSSMVQGMLMANVIAVSSIVIMIFLYKKIPRTLVSATIFVNVFYVIYTALLYMLYLFLMPEVEAEKLAGFTRYQSSAAIFFVGVLMTFVLKEWMEKQTYSSAKWIPKIAAVVVSIVIILPFLNEGRSFFAQNYADADMRPPASNLLTELRQEENISPETPITLINDIGESDHGFLRHLMRYERMTANTFVHTMCTSEEEQKQLTEDINQSDYLMVLNITSEMEDCLEGNSNVENIEPGSYNIKNGVITSKTES